MCRLIDSGKLPHLLLYGPAGTGKTSTILACAHKMYGKHFASMVLELNASDDRGIDVVRNQIKEFVSTRQMFSSAPKMVILDEADNMTSAAQVHSSWAALLPASAPPLPPPLSPTRSYALPASHLPCLYPYQLPLSTLSSIFFVPRKLKAPRRRSSLSAA
mgnify:CR=1 FL=1